MKKSTLYAPRLRGDIDLGLEPSRIDGYGARHWARMTFPGRQLPGFTDQSIYESSSTPKFAIGTRRIEYGRTFRYAKAGRDITTLGPFRRLLANANYAPDTPGHPDEDGFWGDLLGDAKEGAEFLLLDHHPTPARAPNYFQGAYLTAMVPDVIYYTHYIVASDEGTLTYT
ncbi:unnamed protein product, partial [marine sediment metagenome]